MTATVAESPIASPAIASPLTSTEAAELLAFRSKVERQIIIHSAHPYHFVAMDGDRVGSFEGAEGLARALSEDYTDMSQLRELGRRLVALQPADATLRELATKLKCFE